MIGTEGIKVFGETLSMSTNLQIIDLGGIESQLPGCR